MEVYKCKFSLYGDADSKEQFRARCAFSCCIFINYFSNIDTRKVKNDRFTIVLRRLNCRQLCMEWRTVIFWSAGYWGGLPEQSADLFFFKKSHKFVNVFGKTFRIFIASSGFFRYEWISSGVSLASRREKKMTKSLCFFPNRWHFVLKRSVTV